MTSLTRSSTIFVLENSREPPPSNPKEWLKKWRQNIWYNYQEQINLKKEIKHEYV